MHFGKVLFYIYIYIHSHKNKIKQDINAKLTVNTRIPSRNEFQKILLCFYGLQCFLSNPSPLNMNKSAVLEIIPFAPQSWQISNKHFTLLLVHCQPRTYQRSFMGIPKNLKSTSTLGAITTHIVLRAYEHSPLF